MTIYIIFKVMKIHEYLKVFENVLSLMFHLLTRIGLISKS